MKADGSPHCPLKAGMQQPTCIDKTGMSAPERYCVWHSMFRMKITRDFKPKAYNGVIINVDQNNSLSTQQGNKTQRK